MIVPNGAAAPGPGSHRCWCGEESLEPFSPDYLLCRRCSTLIAASPPEDPVRVEDEGSSLYGLNYFNEHAAEMGHPGLEERARLDLPERCAHWLADLLRFRPPPARTLELGCASGAFVALLAEAGYDAAGLELSPAVARLARETFHIPVLTGPLEEQELAPGALDVVVLMDVLEHLPDPVGTLRQIARCLGPEGILLVQTPRFDPGRSYEELRSTEDPFLAQLKPREHLFLLSPSAARDMLAEAGFPFLQFVPAIFAQYDMSFAASGAQLREVPEGTWRAALQRTRSGRLVEALLGESTRARTELPPLRRRVEELERERGALVDRAGELGRALEESQAARTVQEEAIRAQRDELGGLGQRLAQVASELEGLRRDHQALVGEHRELLRRLGFLARFFTPKRSARRAAG